MKGSGEKPSFAILNGVANFRKDSLKHTETKEPTLEERIKHAEQKTKRSPWKFNKDIAKWEEVNIEEELSKYTPPHNREDLILVTYNVWFSTQDREERMKYLGETISSTNADFITLQEVTPYLLKELILKQDWIKNGNSGKPYYVSDADGNTLGNYGNIIISRGIPFVNLDQHSFKTRLGRFGLIGSFEINKGQYFAIVTSHLESYPDDYEIRAIQIKTIINILKKYEHAVFMGDTNIDRDNEDHILLESGFIDTWKTLKAGDNGYTMNPDVNHYAESRRSRLDRIYYRSNALKPVGVRLLGDKEIITPKDNKKIFPSDHFGLEGIFKITL